ncbi:MAG: Na+/H+ antiporter subunit E [Phycisphaeraceae bacterium]|nr:Na+/H+ antiporter subunit E [Phycisphaeraceae bacterium]
MPSTDLGAPSWFRSVLPDLIAGAIVAAVSAWLSLHLLPPRRGRGAWAARARVVGRFFTQLVRAGVEVAWLAMKPRLALRPGCVEFRSGLEEPLERAAFAGMSSLVPGTLAVDPPEGDPWRIHCLDVNAPVVESLRMDEALFDQARRRTALKRERLS